VYKIQGSKTYSYVADFYCAEKKLIIELDGGIHEISEQADYDRGRDALLTELGYKVVRIKNEDLQDMQKGLGLIRNHLE
jgi:leucyl-tRNA synthetase